MKSSALLTIGLLLAALPVAVQAQIHKCITAEAIVYQGTPCAEGQRESLLAHKKTPARINQSDASPPVHRPAPGTPPPLGTTARIDQSNASLSVHRTKIAFGTPLPSAGTPIALGMSDLEVLNLRGWGRPGKITRSKVDGVWREEWVYASPVEGQRPLLQFSNARLTAIQTEPAESAPQQVIRLTQH